MRYFIQITMLLAVMVFLAAAGISCDKKDGETGEGTGATGESKAKVLVKVGETDITEDRINELLNRQKNIMLRQGRPIPPQMEQILRNKIIEDLINAEVILQEVKRQGLKVDENKVQEIYNQEVKTAGDEEKLKLKLLQAGRSVEEFRDRIRQYLMMSKLRDAATANLPAVTDEEARKYYEENKKMFARPETVHAYHILLKVDNNATPEQVEEKKKLIQDILKKAKKKGASFEELAKKHSECPSSAKGGDLGAFGRGRMVKPFEEAAFSLKVGEISDPVRSQFGWHIIKVTEHSDPQTPEFDEVKDMLMKMLERQKKQKAFDDFVQQIREKTNVIFMEGAREPTGVPPIGTPPPGASPPGAPPGK